MMGLGLIALLVGIVLICVIITVIKEGGNL